MTAPLQVNGRLVGLVVLPPPPQRGLLANVGELLSLPGTLALFAVTAIAALVIVLDDGKTDAMWTPFVARRFDWNASCPICSSSPASKTALRRSRHASSRSSRVLSGVARRFERDAADATVTIRTHVESDADQIVADPDRLDQAISNLVANALRHTPSGGTIDLNATVANNGTRITVVDSGRGIAPDHLPHVFERFYKVHASSTSGLAGSGLGLSIAKAIVERHGGTISVTSQPGRTAFVITLPLAAV